MTRVATASTYSAVLDNLMAAQQKQIDAATRVSSQKQATDLKGYSANAETLAALQANQTTVKGYLDQSTVLSNKLSTQDLALNQVADAATGASQAIKNALASGNGDSMMQALQGYFQNAVGGLNMKFDGHYLFSGGQVNTQPVSATQLSDLTAAPSVASLFHNDQYVTSNQLDESTSIKSGFLADGLGTPLFNAFKAIEAYDQGPNGPFTGTLTQAQQTFLQSQIPSFDTAGTNLTYTAGQNGLMQNQVDAATTDLTSRQTMLQTLTGKITDADPAQAAADLSQAQYAVQAAAQVFASLKASSLLTLLPNG
ncbi:flagellin [Caulobacter sp. KR2-114]|uniref:flagellin n=1 Tax=Caulobacter sp. KR2-114 TaxID=3400912 RepID=UPI003C0F27E6